MDPFFRDLRAILFDLDGTLIDTNELIIRSHQHTFRVHLGREVPAEEITPHFGRGLVPIMELFGGKEKAEAMRRTYVEFNWARHDELARPFTGVSEALAELRGLGLRLAIVTGKRREIGQRGLDLFHLREFFDAAVFFDDVEESKPHPAGVLRALELLGEPAERAVMVGDSPLDVECAAAAGVRTIGVRWSAVGEAALLAAKPDYMIGSMSALVELITINHEPRTTRTTRTESGRNQCK
jgi:pyrophosphatase PpaX